MNAGGHEQTNPSLTGVHPHAEEIRAKLFNRLVRPDSENVSVRLQRLDYRFVRL